MCYACVRLFYLGKNENSLKHFLGDWKDSTVSKLPVLYTAVLGSILVPQVVFQDWTKMISVFKDRNKA